MRILLILLSLLISANLNAKVYKLGGLREKPRILVVCSNPHNDKFDDSQMIDMQRRSFAQAIANQIKTEFPCADVFTYADIEMKLENDRRVNELNEYAHFDINDEQSHLKEIMSVLQCDIIISLSAYQLGDKTYLFGRCMSPRTGTVFSSNETHGAGNINDNSELAKNIIRDLVEREICPYKGEITFNSVTTFKDSGERFGLPDQDCEFKATNKEDNKTEESWTFLKKKRNKGTASVSYTVSNYKEVTESDNCHHCKKMENGVKLDVFEANRADMKTSTVITETYSANKADQIDYEGERYNALISIYFDTKANNYSISVKAVTKPAKWTKKTVITNSGCPYDENFEDEIGATYGQKCERTFGPFPGSPYQKSLKQTITKTIIDPDSKGKGKTVETISFNLTR